MNIGKFEIWVHDHILKNDKLRHTLYGAYQRTLYTVSPKIKAEGRITKITPDDEFEYLFGYYDKCPWSDDGRYLLALRVGSARKEADSCEPADIVRIDTATRAVEKLAVSHSWNVQQGCMAQWLSDCEILYNDFRDGKYRGVILNLSTKEERLTQLPIYALSQDKTTALSLDFSRLHRLRPGYGYANLPEATKDEPCPDSPCIWRLDMATGAATPLLRYTELASFEPKDSMRGAEHKVNHLMISPNGKRFMVLHRWFRDGVKYTRLITCGMDGKALYNLSDDDFVSHCCWKNDREIISYLNKRNGGKGYYLLKDGTGDYERLWPSLLMDGHPTCSYDGKYVVTDTYPDRKRIQSIYVMDGGRVKRIARVFSPFRYGGNVRCDLHPRWSRDGRQICFDGSFDGKRAVYLIDAENLYEHTVRQAAAKRSERPKVSVVIPCYNCADFIDDTLDSLERQTFGDFEVICVNDGSSDGTPEKLARWKNKGTLQITILDQANGGVSNARNNGVRSAAGTYVAFLDADDLYHEDFLLRLVEAKEKTGADAAYCRLSRKYDAVMSCEAAGDDCKAQTQKEAMDNLLYRMGEFGFYCYLYDKARLAEIRLAFDEGTKFGEDREFNWKYLAHCRSAAFVDLPLYWYRPNEASATKGQASWRKTDLLTAVSRTEAYLAEQNCAYAEEFKSYMYARSMWAVAKTFALSGDKALYRRLIGEYPVKQCMLRTARDKNRLVRLASAAYLIRPDWFYRIVRLKK